MVQLRKKYKTIHVEEEFYYKFSALVKKAIEHKKTNLTNEVEQALKFFISCNILPSDFNSTDINSKFDLLNTKLESMINRQFGFLTTHEKLILKNNEETRNLSLKLFDTIIEKFSNYYGLFNIEFEMLLAILKANLDENDYEKLRDIFLKKVIKFAKK
ncbi:MAG: hypothetical protein A2033_19135 [Bacteroidetes bacterium GWA2_31_9]|nr:MAG: hypothetical protein A2033_19135 [Bacteroidetes bacterium GWA2_31_9]